METFKNHLPEYAIEAALLGLFMVAAGTFTVLFEYPNSPLHQAFSSAVPEVIANSDLRRFLIGIVMGTTAVALIYSPWGQRSGAHMNPAVTLTFYRLGKVKSQDALFYILFQCLGGLAGVYLVAVGFDRAFTQPPISYIVTVPGAFGWSVALVAEAAIAFVMMMMVLLTSNHPQLGRYTGLFSGCLVLLYVTFEAPLSGFGMNPARSLASALLANIWTAFWLYAIVPPIGMLAAAGLYTYLFGDRAVKCAKLHHHNHQRCIFRCSYEREGKLNLSDRFPVDDR
jgi:aquaporin Z